MKSERKIHPLLKSFSPLVDCIADLFGSYCEVVLHDLSDPEHSIIKIRIGHVTGRKVCDSDSEGGFAAIARDAHRRKIRVKV